MDKPKQQTKVRGFDTRLSPQLRADVVKAAKKLKIKITTFIEEALREKLERMGRNVE